VMSATHTRAGAAAVKVRGTKVRGGSSPRRMTRWSGTCALVTAVSACEAKQESNAHAGTQHAPPPTVRPRSGASRRCRDGSSCPSLRCRVRSWSARARAQGWMCPPGVGATPGNAQETAQGRHRNVLLLRRDERECRYRMMSVSLAKQAAACLRISRSWRSVRTSLCRWRTASRSCGANASRRPSSISACCTPFRKRLVGDPKILGKARKGAVTARQQGEPHRRGTWAVPAWCGAWEHRLMGITCPMIACPPMGQLHLNLSRASRQTR
jgi:hypothetical protein